MNVRFAESNMIFEIHDTRARHLYSYPLTFHYSLKK